MGKLDNPKVLILKGVKYTTIASLNMWFESPPIPLVDDNALLQSTLKQPTRTASRYVGANALNRAPAATLAASEAKTDGEAVPYDNGDLEASLIYGSKREGGLRFAKAILSDRFFSTTVLELELP